MKKMRAFIRVADDDREREYIMRTLQRVSDDSNCAYVFVGNGLNLVDFITPDEVTYTTMLTPEECKMVDKHFNKPIHVEVL